MSEETGPTPTLPERVALESRLEGQARADYYRLRDLLSEATSDAIRAELLIQYPLARKAYEWAEECEWRHRLAAMEKRFANDRLQSLEGWLLEAIRRESGKE